MELVGENSRLWCEISVNLLWGLHREGSFLKTPLPLCTSWCYHNPGPGVDLLWLMASSSASTRVHHIICWEGQTLHPVQWGRCGAAMSGTGKGSGRDRDEVREWKEQSTISVRRLSSLNYKQQFRLFRSAPKKKIGGFALWVSFSSPRGFKLSDPAGGSLTSCSRWTTRACCGLLLWSLVQRTEWFFKKNVLQRKIYSHFCKCMPACAYVWPTLGCRVSESEAMSSVSWLWTLNWAWSSYFNGGLSRVWLWRLWSRGNAVAFDL